MVIGTKPNSVANRVFFIIDSNAPSPKGIAAQSSNAYTTLDPQGKNELSVVRIRPADQDRNSSFNVEACQAVVITGVNLPERANELKEIFCNSQGFALDLKQKGYTYDEYKQIALYAVFNNDPAMIVTAQEFADMPGAGLVILLSQ